MAETLFEDIFAILEESPRYWSGAKCQNIKVKLSLLKKEFQKLKTAQNTTISTKPSYAAVTSSTNAQLDTIHSLQIYPKSSDIKSSEATKQVINFIDLKNVNVGIKSVKPIKKAGISVRCRTESEVKILAEELKKNKDFEIKTPRKKFPVFSFLLAGVDHNIEEIEEELVKKNNMPPDSTLKTVHHFKTRNGNTVIKIEASPSAYHFIVKQNYKLFIGWNCVHLKEQENYVQCFKCQKYGHKAVHCLYEVNKAPALRCKQCGENHEGVCNKSPNCCNCCDHNKVASKRGWDKIDTNHCATDIKCPMRIKAINIGKQYIIYEQWSK